jgi:hypothetical protein
MWNAWERTVYRMLMVKPEGKRSFGTPDIWEYNIKIVLKKWMGGCGLVSSGSG